MPTFPCISTDYELMSAVGGLGRGPTRNNVLPSSVWFITSRRSRQSSMPSITHVCATWQQCTHRRRQSQDLRGSERCVTNIDDVSSSISVVQRCVRKGATHLRGAEGAPGPPIIERAEEAGHGSMQEGTKVRVLLDPDSPIDAPPAACDVTGGDGPLWRHDQLARGLGTTARQEHGLAQAQQLQSHRRPRRHTRIG